VIDPLLGTPGSSQTPNVTERDYVKYENRHLAAHNVAQK
jgi:hypothetical protein